MALYAFDGTWNEDEDADAQDTNVVRFREVYNGSEFEYVAGVGTRLGAVGRFFGGLFGMGGRSRIREMIETLEENWAAGDHDVDIVGFSRGAALAVHFANTLATEGIQVDGRVVLPRIRFLGLWDVVGSFGLASDTIVDFQQINLGWDFERVAEQVETCCHAMALDERRETFGVTRLDPEHRHDHVTEVWFRGVHSDIGGGNGNPARSNIALNWMLERAREAGVPIHEGRARETRYATTDPAAPLFENTDIALDPRREVLAGDTIHPSARAIRLAPGERHQCTVRSEVLYEWSGVELTAGARYRVTVPPGQTWEDASIACDAAGWSTDQLPWYKEGLIRFAERWRRVPEANWFELIGALGDEDDDLIRIGNGAGFQADRTADLYLFANDMKSKYDNNVGSLDVVVERIA